MNNYILTEGKTISGGVGRVPTTPKPKIRMVAQHPYPTDITRDWTKEDNIDQFFENESPRRRGQKLNDFIFDCLTAMCMKCDAGRGFKEPGQAVQWYMAMMSEEDAEFFRKKLKAKHFKPWGSYGKAILYDMHTARDYSHMKSEESFKEDERQKKLRKSKGKL